MRPARTEQKNDFRMIRLERGIRSPLDGFPHACGDDSTLNLLLNYCNVFSPRLWGVLSPPAAVPAQLQHLPDTVGGCDFSGI